MQDNSNLFDFSKIQDAIVEVQQSRSQFQIEKFVIGQHPTKEMQYYQVCIELQDMIYKYKYATIQIAIHNEKIKKYRSKDDTVSNLKALKEELDLEQLQVTMVGAEREMLNLMAIWESFDHKFSRAEIETAQPQYWKERFTNNARAMLSSGTGINPSHLEAMDQAGVLDAFVAEIELEKKELEI
jgi:hypothetical protein